MAPRLMLGRVADLLSGIIDDALVTYAQVVFSRSRIVGVLLLAATALDARALVNGLAAVALAPLFARALGGKRDAPYGTNALLVGLGLAQVGAGFVTCVALTASATGAVVLVTYALTSLLARAQLPVLSLPFVLVHWATIALGFAPAIAHAPGGGLDALGALFFLPRADVGLLVLAALVVHSRIGALLFASAFGALTILGAAFALPLPAATTSGLLLNASLSALAIGGVWFVPSASAFALGLAGAMLAALIELALSPVLSRAGLPVSILPFNAAVLTVLLASRQRSYDRAPKSVDFIPGTPEENLAYFQTRLARFRALYTVTFSLPFRGAWTCTQGVDGAHTHQGDWRHGFDFEVEGDTGASFAENGTRKEDHHCWKLPVLAAADGVVARIVDGVRDNDVGEQDLESNWGNVVVLQHAPGLCSLVAHLAAGTLRVREGQLVKRGDLLGLCGSSGRSPRPHLHFQLQATPDLGAPTLPCRFSDLVFRRAGGDEELALAETPREGDVMRNLDGAQELAAFFRVEPGEVFAFRSGGRTEHLVHEVDLYGNMLLTSREHGATVSFARTEETFTTFDALGPRRSVVHMLRAALPRVPFDRGAALAWTDYLPSRWTGWSLLRPIRELFAPFAPDAGVLMRYRARLAGNTLEVIGESSKTRRGEPLVHTRATLLLGSGLTELFVRIGEKVVTCTRERVARGELWRRVSEERKPILERSNIDMSMQRMKCLGVTLLVAAGCARGRGESIEEDKAALTTAQVRMDVADRSRTSVTNAEAAGAGVDAASAAFQKSYDDEAVGHADVALADLSPISASGNVQYTAEYRRGWLLYKLGKNAESVAAYKRASEVEPAALEPRVGALLPLSAMRRWADVESTAREVLRRDPGNYTANIRLAFALYSQARFGDAEATYRALLAMYPSDVEVRAGLGFALLKEQKTAAAQAAFNEVLSIAPKNALALEGAAAASR